MDREDVPLHEELIGIKPISGVAQSLQVSREPPPFVEKEVRVGRGGEFVGNRMRFKVKILNDTPFMITDVKVYLISYPSEALNLEGNDDEIFVKIEPGGLRTSTFDFLPTQDCVRGDINAGVTYLDEREQVHTLSTRPFTIRSVCDLLLPQRIAPSDFRLKIKELDCGEIVLRIDEWTPEEMFEKSLRIIDDSNFFEVTSKIEYDAGTVYAIISGFAQGKYTRKEVAVQIDITGPKGKKGASCKISVSGEDNAMIMPTIDDLRERLNAWLCPQCGGLLTLVNVESLKTGKVVKCTFCGVSIGR
jgi:hypothetical protein